VTFPPLAGLRFCHGWGGTVAFMRDFMPSIGHLERPVYVFRARAFDDEGVVMTRLAAVYHPLAPVSDRPPDLAAGNMNRNSPERPPAPIARMPMRRRDTASSASARCPSWPVDLLPSLRLA